MSTQVFNIFEKPSFDDSIRRVEERTYYPYVKSFGNSDNVEICVNQTDSWFLMSESSISIKGKLEITSTADGAAAVTLAPNAPAFFFDSITYEQCGKEMETVRDPGRVSTMRGYLCYETSYSKDLYTAGWNYPGKPTVSASDNSFHFIIPLKHLFGIFNDYTKVTCGKQILRMVRARSDNDCLQIPDGKSTAKIVINSIELKVIHIFPNDDIKLKLLQAVKRDAPIIVPFMKWELHELPALKAGATREIWAVKTTSSVESPRFVIVGFQTDRNANPKNDPTAFDHINISNIRLTLNSEYWPNERMDLDFATSDFMQAFKNYTAFYQSYSGEARPSLLDYVAFKTHTLFVIDCSRREESIKSSTVDIKVDIEAKVGFPDKTKAFCLIIHDCVMEYLPLSEIVRSLS